MARGDPTVLASEVTTPNFEGQIKLNASLRKEGFSPNVEDASN